LCSCYDNLAGSLAEVGRLQEAVEAFKKAIEMELPLTGKSPDVPDY
jgi:hypothetical protein